jgi:hypothetical protein
MDGRPGYLSLFGHCGSGSLGNCGLLMNVIALVDMALKELLVDYSGGPSTTEGVPVPCTVALTVQSVMYRMIILLTSVPQLHGGRTKCVGAPPNVGERGEACACVWCKAGRPSGMASVSCILQVEACRNHNFPCCLLGQ